MPFGDLISFPLFIRYDKKDQAKALGAKWDGDSRLWWCRAGTLRADELRQISEANLRECPELPTLYSHLDVTSRQMVRFKYMVNQNWLCAHCNEGIFGPARSDIRETEIDRDRLAAWFFNHPIHLHSDINTDYTIGAVHAQCHAVLLMDVSDEDRIRHLNKRIVKIISKAIKVGCKEQYLKLALKSSI